MNINRIMRSHWVHGVYLCSACGRAFGWGRDSDHDPEGWWVSCSEACSELLRAPVLAPIAWGMPGVDRTENVQEKANYDD